jgi:hypothetical protein
MGLIDVTMRESREWKIMPAHHVCFDEKLPGQPTLTLKRHNMIQPLM